MSYFEADGVISNNIIVVDLKKVIYANTIAGYYNKMKLYESMHGTLESMHGTLHSWTLAYFCRLEKIHVFVHMFHIQTGFK